MTIDVERITPTQAKEYLEANSSNRNMREAAVKKYARDIANGNWKLTGEPIQFNDQGGLLNGQHRLAAIVKAKKAVKMVVMRGVSHESVAFMDTGAKRTFADVLKMNGYTNVNILAAAVRFAIRYENEWLKSRDTPTHGEMLMWLNANPDFPNSINKASVSPRMRRYFPATAAPFIHWKTKDSMPGEFDNFMALVLGEAIDSDYAKKDSPPHAYRRYMETHMLMKARKVQPLMLQAILVKAFNAHIEGVEKVSNFRWRIGGAAAEDFPTLITEYPG